jgi:trehalose 6-phosphate phosphatase
LYRSNSKEKMHTSGTDAPPPPPDLLNGASLFVDFDGTLVEIAARPDAIEIDERLRLLMRRLATRLDGRLAVVSGRPAREVRRLFGTPSLVIGGSHGLELHWADGRTSSPPRPEGLDHVLAEMCRLRDAHPGILIEDKPFGAALHYRQAPEAEAACHALALRLSRESGLPLQRGKMMVEVRAQGADKGAALMAFMAEPGMAGTRPIFIGDDETDEAGFLAAAALGGAGILVGPPRASAARYRLEGVAATLAWLDAACGGAA